MALRYMLKCDELGRYIEDSETYLSHIELIIKLEQEG